MISTEEIKDCSTVKEIVEMIEASSNCPELRGILHKFGIKIRLNYTLQLAFKKQISYLKKYWNPYDNFFQSMVSNLEEDYELEMMEDYERPVEEISIVSEQTKRKEIYTFRGIVEVRFLEPTGNLMKEVEYETIRHILNLTNGNRTEASKILGISLRTLRNKLQEYSNSGLLIQKKISNKQVIEKDNPLNPPKFLGSVKTEVTTVTNKPFQMAKCCPNNFVWENGLCFKCWKERKSNDTTSPQIL